MEIAESPVTLIGPHPHVGHNHRWWEEGERIGPRSRYIGVALAAVTLGIPSVTLALMAVTLIALAREDIAIGPSNPFVFFAFGMFYGNPITALANGASVAVTAMAMTTPAKPRPGWANPGTLALGATSLMASFLFTLMISGLGR